jgi:hypothetical protein
LTENAIRIKTLSGKDAELKDYVPALARLRIEIFRNFPYLYDGSMDYEENYLKTYTECPETCVIMALDGEKVVGASTGIPMTFESENFQLPFKSHGFNIGEVFYCGESVLLDAYRGQGLYKNFIFGREKHAKSLGRFKWIGFCSVQRDQNHPLRPAGYEPLDGIWNHYGYRKHPEIEATYSWKDIDQADETEHKLVFWLKSIAPESEP